MIVITIGLFAFGFSIAGFVISTLREISSDTQASVLFMVIGAGVVAWWLETNVAKPLRRMTAREGQQTEEDLFDREGFENVSFKELKEKIDQKR